MLLRAHLCVLRENLCALCGSIYHEGHKEHTKSTKMRPYAPVRKSGKAVLLPLHIVAVQILRVPQVHSSPQHNGVCPTVAGSLVR